MRTQRVRDEGADRADSMSNTPCWWQFAGIGRWSPGYDGPSEAGWCEHRSQILAGALRRRGARRFRNAHDSCSAKICYRYHPQHGVEVELVRYLRPDTAAVLIVRLPDGSQLAIAEWMLSPEICEQLPLEPEPRIKLSALVDLRRLIDSQSQTTPSPTSCGQSARGGQDDAQQPKAEHPTAGASLRRRGDLDEAAGGGAGTLPDSLEGATGKRSEQRRREAAR